MAYNICRCLVAISLPKCYNWHMENATGDNEAVALDLLLEKVCQDGGHDFRGYRRSTVTRRLQRRLWASGARTYQDYMQFLDAHPEECEKLVDCLTVCVSGFYRSPYTFEQFSRLVVPELVASKKRQGDRSLSFWSTACARGEEPYSIALLFADYLGDERKNFNISLYATDINRRVLREAQAGVYPPGELESLPPALLTKYFTAGNKDYTINSAIKEMVSFSYFDLVSPSALPFTNVDGIFCRNVLIYLQKHLQQKVLEMLFNSLATPGYLILGEVETPTQSFDGKLRCLNSRAKIYKKDSRRG